MWKDRIRLGNEEEVNPKGQCVVYWMDSAQRPMDNLALSRAVDVANTLRKPVVVYLGLSDTLNDLNLRGAQFLVEGLVSLEETLQRRGIGWVLRLASPETGIVKFLKEVKACALVTDDSHLRQGRQWRETVASRISVRMEIVDANVVVPVRLFPEEENTLYAFRPKIEQYLPYYLQPIPNPAPVVKRLPKLPPNPPAASLLAKLKLDDTVGPSHRFHGGAPEAQRHLERFLQYHASQYERALHDPSRDAGSHLSMYLNYGHIAPQTVALAVQNSPLPEAAKALFLDHLIARRELAFNFTHYNSRYDSLRCGPTWARATLSKHRRDRRTHRYTYSQFESGRTHEALWNAAQLEMVQSGYMHGYLRPYWAKKILKWTRSPEEAFEIVLRLNNRYELDGRSPSSYASIASAIAGKHDFPVTPERPIFGSLRDISIDELRAAFPIEDYLTRVLA